MTERKRVTLEFFEQLREPERSEAIDNFDEGYSGIVPKSESESLQLGFNWRESPQEEDYWDEIDDRLFDGSYHTKPFDIEDICYSVENENDFNCSWIEIHKIVKATYNKLKELGKIKD